MAETITLVIPTISRPTLARTLLSVRDQDWRPGDEILLVGDGPQPVAKELWDQMTLPGRYLELTPAGGKWGHGIRNWINRTRQARGAYLGALDDDDVWSPNALATVRHAIRERPGRPLLFRMDWRTRKDWRPDNEVLWAEKELVRGNVGTPMLVCPNDPKRLGTWGMEYTGDFDFIDQTCRFYPDGPVWRKEVICVVRPRVE